MSARPTKLTNLNVSGNLTVGGTTITAGVVDDLTISAGKTLAVTTADKLTVGGKIVPQTFFIQLRADSVLYVLPVACKVVSVRERHATAEVTAATLTAMLKKVASGAAIAAGTDCLAAGVNMKATADTNQSPALHGTAGNYTLAAGDALGVLLSAAATELALEAFTVQLQRV